MYNIYTIKVLNKLNLYYNLLKVKKLISMMK